MAWGHACFHTPCPRRGRSRPSIPPGRLSARCLRPATLVLVAVAAAAAIARAFWAPFPGPGGNPVLDLVAYHDLIQASTP